MRHLLSSFGYRVRADGGDREEQFQCDLHGDGRDNKPSARFYPDNTWYCVDIREPILTDNGWVLLGDLASDSCRVLNGNGEWKTPLQYIPRGQKELIKIQTSAGYSVKVTPEHEIDVLGKGWVKARDILVGDILKVVAPTVPCFPVGKEIPVADLNTRKYQGRLSLNLPDRWSLELGECLGYIFGDGWVTHRENPSSGIVGLTSHADDADDARRIFNIMQDWVPGRGSESHRTDATHVNGRVYRQNQYVFSIGNDDFCRFFQRLGLDKGRPPKERRIPGGLWQAPEEGVRGFLRGVFATDGTAFQPKDRSKIIINLYSVSGDFLSDVQMLLLQFGVYSRIYKPANTSGRSPCWYLQLATSADILTFRERIGFANKRKQEVLNSFVLNPKGTRGFKPVVSGISPAGVFEVADIAMPVEHSFIAGGIKVHNCFACGITRDTIATVRAKVDLDFMGAVEWLETKYNLPPMPFEEGDDQTPRTATQQIADSIVTSQTFDEIKDQTRKRLDRVTKERSLPLDDILKFWEAFDQISYGHHKDQIPEHKAKRAMALLAVSILEKLKEAIQSENSQVHH